MPLLVLFAFTVQLDKTNISAVIVDTTFLKDLNLIGKPTHIGLLNSCFAAGYGIGMFLWGFAIDAIGARRSAMAGICAWSALTLMCGYTDNVTEMYVARALLGAAEGCLWPIANSYFGRWFPASERSKATAIWISGGFIAIATGVPISTVVLIELGWRGVFITLGAVSFVALPLFYLFGCDDPSSSPFTSDSEVDHIRKGNPTRLMAEKGDEPSLIESLLTLRIALLILVHATSSLMLWGLTTWIPTYLVRERGISLRSMGGIVLLSYVAPIIATVIAGHLADRARHRAWVGAVVSLVTMVVLTVAMGVPWLYVTAFLLVFGIASPLICGGLHSAMLHDYVPSSQIARSTGIVVGLGNLFGALSPALMGYVSGLFGGQFLVAFMMLIGVNAVSMIVYTAIAMMKPTIRRRRRSDATVLDVGSRS